MTENEREVYILTDEEEAEAQREIALDPEAPEWTGEDWERARPAIDPKLKLEDWVGRMVDVIIDRPMGTTHPRDSDIVYPINYGYIPGTMAPDGHPIDAYVLGADSPLKECSARVIAVIRRRDDVEDKLVVALSGEWSKASISQSTAFQEQWFDSWVELPGSGEVQ